MRRETLPDEVPAAAGDAIMPKGAMAELEAAFDELVADLRYAVADERSAERLAGVGCLCLLRVKEAPHLEAWMHLDSEPLEVDDRPADRDAEIELVIPAVRVATFWETSLPMGVLRGDVAFRGPVRRFLQMYPILRAQARARRGESAEATV
jgi:hypothetical protein